MCHVLGRASPGCLQMSWETQSGDAVGMKLGLLVLCSDESTAEDAFLLPEQGWELTHLAGDKPALCTGLGSGFSSSCLKVKELF